MKNRKSKLIDNAIRALDDLKKYYPDTEIYIDTPNGMKECRLGDALIYETPNNHICIDAG